ncbi:DUF1707 SHOCT-like domain-containing protein [Streptosporangium sp. KLBMP 9127]|nr:DUF1707 domain-containing protein [Streptosporangium sp. KLBMP 9127]
MRASDSDRDRVAGLLREHYAQGRLTVEEFDERLEQLYQSKTYGELQVLTADLPDTDMRALARRSASKPAKTGNADKGMRAAWAAWGTASGINWVIWLIVGVTGGNMVYPWPLWVMGPWGVVLLVATISAGAGKGRNR